MEFMYGEFVKGNGRGGIYCFVQEMPKFNGLCYVHPVSIQKDSVVVEIDSWLLFNKDDIQPISIEEENKIKEIFKNVK